MYGTSFRIPQFNPTQCQQSTQYAIGWGGKSKIYINPDVSTFQKVIQFVFKIINSNTMNDILIKIVPKIHNPVSKDSYIN